MSPARSATRLLDRFGPDLAALSGDELAAAITASEGRVLLGEIIANAAPLLAGSSNAELVAAMGADLICLNLFDPSRDDLPVLGLEELDPAPTRLTGLSTLLGRPVGLNLEPDVEEVPPPFRATKRQVDAAALSGAAFVMVTANPGRGVGEAELAAAVDVVRTTAPELLCLAGKMHQAGRREELGPATVEALADAGAHGVLVPLPGTVPGMSEDRARAMTNAAHRRELLAVGTIGTSQEGADPDTIRRLALTAKRVGVDLHHLGDAGLTGVAQPENVYTYGVAVRGVRHTWNRMARNHRSTWGGH